MFGFSMNRHSNLYSPAVRSISVPFLQTLRVKRSAFIPLELSSVFGCSKLLLLRRSAFTLDKNIESLNGRQYQAP